MKHRWFAFFILTTTAVLLLSAASQIEVNQMGNLLNREIARNFARGMLP
jgi:hypothetical protein